MLRRFAPRMVAPVATGAVHAQCCLQSTAVNKQRVWTGPNLKGLKDTTLDIMLNEKIYSESLLREEVSLYFDLGLEASYFKWFKPEHIAEHIQCFIAAKKLALSDGHAQDIKIQIEKDDYAVFMCSDAMDSKLEMEGTIEHYLRKNEKNKPDHAISIRSYTSTKAATYFGVKLVMYSVNYTPFLKGKEGLARLTTQSFITERSPANQQRYARLLNSLETSVGPVCDVVTLDDQCLLSIAVLPDRVSYLAETTQVIASISRAQVTKKFVETFANGAHVYTLYVKNAHPDELREKAIMLGFLPDNPTDPVSQAFTEGKVTSEQMLYCFSLVTFAYYFMPKMDSAEFLGLESKFADDPANRARLLRVRSDLWRDKISEDFLGETLVANLETTLELFEDFKKRTAGVEDNFLEDQIVQRFGNSLTAMVMYTCLSFNKHVMKTNFFKVDKAGISFRLNTSFCKQLDFPDVPYGMFMFIGPQFRGFHLRFADIARGGIRIVASPNKQAYTTNLHKLFTEIYNLAHTQHRKNKDIPEGGSKGIILLDPRYRVNRETSDSIAASLKPVFMKFVDSMLDLLLPSTEGVRSTTDLQEILFLGPDENTAGEFPTHAMLHAKSRGYPYWKSFTTGKNPLYGGIPHDVDGMTTRSVRRCAYGIQNMLKLKEETLTKVQTGGPDGDLGSNEILQTKDKTIAIIDGSGVLYDPDGLNREELNRLAKKRVMGHQFNKKALGKMGYFVSVEDRNVTLPDGTKVPNGIVFRNEFQFYVTADFMVPCGGRPESINIQNVHRLLVNMDGVTGDDMIAGKVGDLSQTKNLRYKYIVEGANLFITEDARHALENVGVILFKDATANKGGVTSSSLEVLCGLALTDEEHRAHMSCTPDHMPAFYKKYKQEIMNIVERNADKEFGCIWRESEARGKGCRRAVISDQLSRKIVSMQALISSSGLFNNKNLVVKVLNRDLPKLLLEHVGIDNILQRVPENYLREIFSSALAADFVYTYGLRAGDFDFYNYLRAFEKK